MPVLTFKIKGDEQIYAITRLEDLTKLMRANEVYEELKQAILCKDHQAKHAFWR